jgi:hypothetical protein
MFENLTDTLVGLGGTLEILVGINLLSHLFALNSDIAPSVCPMEAITAAMAQPRDGKKLGYRVSIAHTCSGVTGF